MLTQCHHKCGWRFPGSQRSDGDVGPDYTKKAAVLLTLSLGLAGIKLLFTNILGMGIRVEKGWGDWVLQYGTDEKLETH